MGKFTSASALGGIRGPVMEPRERVLATLDHKEPDRVPLDLGATANSGLHRQAYGTLRSYLGLPDLPIRLADTIQQAAYIDKDLADLLEVDARGVAAYYAPTDVLDTDEDSRFVDDYGIGWRMPRVGGLYFDMYLHPLQGDVDEEVLRRYPWPPAPTRQQLLPMLSEIRSITRQQRRAVVVESVCSGMLETAAWLRGYEDFYSDVALNPRLAGQVLDRVLEQKLQYWDNALDLFGGDIDVVKEADDLGAQGGPLISPDAYRRLVKPRQRELFDAIRKKTSARILLHSCGSIRALIPDLIDVWVQILNPVQVSAAGMDTAELKGEFGRDMVFWGGGVDTQRVLSSGSVADVRNDVRRRLDDLMPGGGFVFAAVHNVQADVPPANVMAMWQAMREFGVYG